jgi:ferrous iron transport protein B
MSAAPLVALVGNPNAGKTSIFNGLTGASVRVGNYPGVTVERTVGRLRAASRPIDVVDVPGAYSLCARSADEAIAVESLLGEAAASALTGVGRSGALAFPPPDLVVLVLDATQLERNLYFGLQVLELGRPTLVALNQIDAAEVHGTKIDTEALSAALGVPVIPVVGTKRDTLVALAQHIEAAIAQPPPPARWAWQPAGELAEDLRSITEALPEAARAEASRNALALWALMSVEADDEGVPAPLRTLVATRRANAEAADRDVDAEVAQARYAAIDALAPSFMTRSLGARAADKLDRVFLHPVGGFALFLLFMLLIFQALFAWSDPLIGLVELGVGALADLSRTLMPEGLVADFVAEAVIGGVGNVVVFVPQIALLFVFLALMEDSGYMSRVAFLMDRIMRRVGLHGRAFVPMLSGFACAIPAVMATRTLERQRDRTLTMMIIPLMTCSARLPVYTLLIGAVIPASTVLGIFGAQSLVMVGLYVFAVLIALLAGAVLSRTVLKGRPEPLLLELPDYRRPKARAVFGLALNRSWAFVQGAGSMILGFTAIMWALVTFPQETPGSKALSAERAQAESRLAPTLSAEDKASALEDYDRRIEAIRREESFAGRIGHAMEPVIKPLGFNWEVGVGILGAFAAREVFVSTMGVVYGVGAEVDEESPTLRARVAAARHSDGRPVYTPLMGLSLMVFFALACQCISTLAAVKRETRSWRWPLFLFTYMSVLAWVCAFAVYQGGRALGFS